MKVTAGAATALLLDPAARSIQDSAAEVHEEAPPSSHGYAHDGPVGRARERWKEARNEMPEVCAQFCNRYDATRTQPYCSLLLCLFVTHEVK